MFRCKEEHGDVHVKMSRTPYKDGYKYCSICVIFLETEDFTCYCCGVKLRLGKKGKKR